MAPNVAQLIQRLRAAAGSERVSAGDFTALVGDTFRHAGLTAADADIAAEVAAYGTCTARTPTARCRCRFYITGLLDARSRRPTSRPPTTCRAAW